MCAKLGLKVNLFERARLCSATSGNSLRIIHGGIRYLQNLDIGRTLESVRAQEELIQFAPGLIRRLPCLMPLQAFGLRSYLPTAIGAFIYDRLGRRLGRAKRSLILPSRYFTKHCCQLARLTNYGALLWHDAYIVDLPGFESHLREKLRASAVNLLEGSEVKRVARSAGGFTLETSIPNQETQAEVVINCAGARLDSVHISGITAPQRNNTWCRAFNLVVKKRLSERFAIGMRSPAGRLLFFVPRGNGSAIGTGYLHCTPGSHELEISSAEIDTFLADVNNTVPQLGLIRADILGTEVGILPATTKYDRSEPEPCAHTHISEDRGYFELLSTKYTTFLTQGEKLAQLVARHIRVSRQSLSSKL